MSRLVDYGDDSDEESSEKNDGDEKPFSLTNILFGNIAENGDVDAPYLDEESKQHLVNLGTFSQIREAARELSGDDGARSELGSTSIDDTSSLSETRVAFLPSAVDYSHVSDEDDYDLVKSAAASSSEVTHYIQQIATDDVGELATAINISTVTIPAPPPPPPEPELSNKFALSPRTIEDDYDLEIKADDTPNRPAVVGIPLVFQTVADSDLILREQLETTPPGSPEIQILSLKDWASASTRNLEVEHSDTPTRESDVCGTTSEADTRITAPVDVVDGPGANTDVRTEHSAPVPEFVAQSEPLEFVADIPPISRNLSPKLSERVDLDLDDMPVDDISAVKSTIAERDEADNAVDENLSVSQQNAVMEVDEEAPVHPGDADKTGTTEIAVSVDIAEPNSGGGPKLTTPLASVLPPELSNVNVNDVFPDFKSDVVLRFSRLFGPGRPSSLPKRWVNYRKKAEVEPELPVEEDDDRTDEEILEELLAEKWPAEVPVPVSDKRIVDQTETETAVQNIPEPSTMESESPRRLDSSAIAPWRYGPGKYWYDQLAIDPTGENFSYVDKRQKQPPPTTSYSAGYGNNKVSLKLDVEDEAFFMISLGNWEQDVIWDGANFKADVEKLMAEKRTAAGWVPSGQHRTAAQFLCKQKLGPNQAPPPLDLTHDSMFPAENEELIDGSWMKNIIWDASDVENLPEPTVLMLDPNDPNIILDFPEEEEYETINKEPTLTQGKEKKDVFKRSRMVLGKAGMLKDPDSPKGLDDPKDDFKDPFNLSNDEYYSPKADETSLKSTTGAVAVHHSTPILNLDPVFAPPNINVTSRLRKYHRPELKKYSNGLITHPGPHPIDNLLRIMKKKAKQREAEVAAAGGVEVFFMREPADLSGCDGELILAEYCEEYPPLISQIGMGTRIKNYYKRRPGKNEEVLPEFTYGEITQAHTSPFLGTLAPGQFIQAFENNMYRAPIYQHTMPSTDFLIIRNRNKYVIREVRVVFAVGQECPLIEVPAPNSKKATNFIRDYLQVNILRIFAKSTETPKRFRIEDFNKLKVYSQESAIRKRLKTCAESQRGGGESNSWSLKAEFRLPTEEELREKVTPEDYCAFYSMRSAEQRLTDAGYGEKLILAVDDEGDDEQQSKMDDEIKAAPWNTTRAFIAAMKNNCILQLTGDADPTGRGEGFSYVKVQTKMPEKDGVPHTKKIVTGTDADLRKLSLQNAKQLLRKYGCSDEKIKKLTRWEIIALVRTLGTEQARAGAEESMSKFARGSRYSAMQQQEKYKEDCQRIFELQNRILASEEVLSTDDEISEDEDDSDLEQIAGDLEEFIQSKKSSREIRFEREEEERKELKKLLNQEEAAAKKLKKKNTKKKEEGAVEEPPEDAAPAPLRKLRIVRTYRDEKGPSFDRVEIVSRPALIDAYTRIRTTKDEDFIRSFASADTDKKLKTRKYKRKQEPNRTEAELAAANEAKERRRPKKDSSQLKVRCGACGLIGHMRTNKVCPMAGETFNLVMSKEDEEREIGHVIEDSGLVRVEGAKITLRKEVLSQAEEIRRKSLIVKIPKILTDENLQFEKEERRQRKKEKRDRERLEEDDSRDVLRKKRRTDNVPEYLEKPSQTTSRRRVDPVVSLSGYLKAILDKIRELPGTEPFRAPVSLKSYPTYLLTIPDPMDLGTMRTKLNEGKYHRREEFLDDLSLIVNNCSMFNGANAKMTIDAHKMIQVCLEAFQKDEERFKKLEKMINPLLDDNDQNALSYIFEQIISNKMKAVDHSSLFHTPVNRKLIKDYYEIIKEPMDFETMLQKTKSHRYQTHFQFLTDVELVRGNCYRFNGENSPYSRTADEVVRVAKAAVDEQAELIAPLESAIKSAQEASYDDNDNESVGTAGSDSEHMSTNASRVDSRTDFVEEDSRQMVMSDAGDEEMIDLTGASRAGSVDRDNKSRLDSNMDSRAFESPDEPDVLDDGSSSRPEYPPSPPIRKKPLRLSMGSTSLYYDDAQTGFDDESNQAEMNADDQPQPTTSRTVDITESASPTVSPPLPPTRVSTLEQDLHVSDSESEEEKEKEVVKEEVETPRSPDAEDQDEDGLWF